MSKYSADLDILHSSNITFLLIYVEFDLYRPVDLICKMKWHNISLII